MESKSTTKDSNGFVKTLKMIGYWVLIIIVANIIGRTPLGKYDVLGNSIAWGILIIIPFLVFKKKSVKVNTQYKIDGSQVSEHPTETEVYDLQRPTETNAQKPSVAQQPKYNFVTIKQNHIQVNLPLNDKSDKNRNLKGRL